MEERSQPKVTLQKNESNVGPYEIFEFCVDGSPEREKRQVNVLLIHGLIGDPIKTWGGSLDRDKTVSDCWPRKLAIELQSKATFWTLGYRAPLFDKELDKIPSGINEEGATALEEVVRARLGDRPIVFVTHSLGGLLAKAILIRSAKHDSPSPERQILESTHAVIFAGTPHAGSLQTKWRFLIPFVVHLATKAVGALVVALAALVIAAASPVLAVYLFGLTWQATLGGLLATLLVVILGVWMGSRLAPGRHVLMLDPNNAGLRELTTDFRSLQSEHTFFTDSFYEEKALWSLFLVVPWWSADPGVTGCEPKGIPADHISMCNDPLLQRRVKDRVETARRGKDTSVFGEKLEYLFKNDSKLAHAHKVLFKNEDGDRGKVEEPFRTALREKMRRGKFVPASAELDLALHSDFDEDELVRNLWYEQTFADGLRHLRTKAKKEVENDYRSAPGSRATLIPFYRSLRTIEHICACDLPDPGFSNESDRDLLLKLITEAREKLEKLCPNVKVTRKDGKECPLDADGRTRRLLLRMWCMLQAVSATQNYVRTGPMGKQGEELAVFLGKSRTAFDNALEKFRNELKPLP